MNVLTSFSFLILGGFPGSSDGKESACDAGDLRSIPGWGRSPGEGSNNPLQYAKVMSLLFNMLPRFVVLLPHINPPFTLCNIL